MESYKNLSARDKKTLKTGGIIAALLLFITIVLIPLKDKDSYYGKKIKRKQKVAEEVSRMSARYKVLKERFDNIKSSVKNEKRDFTLFSFLDSSASKAMLKDHIKGMRPSIQSRDDYTESTVTVELEDVDIKSLITFIHTIETSGHNLKIKKVDIKPRYSQPDKINVTLLISSIELKIL